MSAMKKRLFVLVFCAVLFAAVYRVGYNHRDMDAATEEVNDIAVEAWQEPNEPNDVSVSQADRIVR